MRDLSGFIRFHYLNFDFVSVRHTLELVRAVGGEEGACVLEVHELGLALQCLLAGLDETLGWA